VFIVSNDKSARAQLAGVMAELENRVSAISAKRAKLEREGKQRTDAYKALTAEKGALNETLAFIQSIDVMQDSPSGARIDLSAPEQVAHIPTYVNRNGYVDVICSCGDTLICNTASLINADHAVGRHIRKKAIS
jgi:hypothetical protein